MIIYINFLNTENTTDIHICNNIRTCTETTSGEKMKTKKKDCEDVNSGLQLYT